MGSGVTGNTADSGSVIQGSIPCSPANMSRPRKRADGQPVTEPTRDALLRITVEHLNEGGEANIRLESILAEADCSPSSLYHHFGNLRGLVEEAQLVRFSKNLDQRSAHFVNAVAEISSREEMIRFARNELEKYCTAEGAVYRSQRADALGSTYKHDLFAKRMGQAYVESCERVGKALAAAQRKKFISPEVDTEVFALWIYGIMFSRVLLELTGDEDLGQRWNAISVRAALFTLFDDPDPR